MNRYLNSTRNALIGLLASLPIFLIANTSPDMATLACTSQINVSANDNCALDLAPEQLLEGVADPGPYEMNIELGNGQYVDFSDVSQHINETLKYTIKHTLTQNYCWGYITIEDKIAPTVVCNSCTDPLVTDADCILNCAEYPLFKHFNAETGQLGYDVDLLDKIIESDVNDFIRDYVSDNCNQSAHVYYKDRFSSADCGEDIFLYRTWVVEYDLPNGNIGTVECNKYYKFVTLDVYDALGDPLIVEGDGTQVEDMIFMPEQNVTVSGCAEGYSPDDIAGYFDNPLTEDHDSDDDGIDPDEGDVDCVIENNEGIWHAYPHYYSYGLKNNSLHAQPITENVCTVNAYYDDIVLEACSPECGGNVKVARTWTILDWCSSNFFQYLQTIDIVDMVPPVIDVSEIEVSVDPWACSATFKVPAPEHMYDECGGEVSYSVELYKTLIEITGSEEEGYTVHSLERGIYELIYIIHMDCCLCRKS